MEEGSFDLLAARTHVLTVPGCTSAEAYQSVDRTDHVVLITHWTDEQSLAAYTGPGRHAWDFVSVP
jgi:quinol monooxygenase YgiN